MLFRRSFVAGGTYFFTVSLEDGRSALLIERAHALRRAVRAVRERHPFDIVAWVVLPDHLHAVVTLPERDGDFARRWSLVKAAFATELLDGADRNGTIWQRRFLERLLDDGEDLARHVDFLHADPVRHGYVERPSDWPYSSIHRHARQGARAPPGYRPLAAAS